MAVIVTVDQNEYSVSEHGSQIVTAYLTFPSATGGDTFTVDLVREDGFGAISTVTVTLASGQTQATTSFDLRDAKDTYGFVVARHGWYTVQATQGSTGITTSSETFYVGLVTVNELKNMWCYGVPFDSAGANGLVVQPRVVTGVTIPTVPSQMPRGMHALAYQPATSSAPATLSWDSGTPVPITEPGPAYYALVNQTGQDYVRAQVVPGQLPLTAVNEPLIVDHLAMDDEYLRRLIEMAQGFIEQAIWCFAEPTYVGTDPQTLAAGPETNVFTGWCDHTGIPQSYYRPRDFMRWMAMVMPYNRLLKVLNLTGYFNHTLTLQVTLDWIVWNETNGEVELVPSNGAVVTWQFYESAMLQFLYIYNHIPSFWHYWVIAGLRHEHELHAPVRELIAKKAAYDAIALAGSAYSAGMQTRSTSRDGVTGNIGYQQGYPWAALANQYGQFLWGPKLDYHHSQILKIKKRAIGPSLIVT